MIFVHKIDANGLFIEDAFVDAITSDCIETPCPAGFYWPKWDGTKWVEGKTAQEIAVITASAAAEKKVKAGKTKKMSTDERLTRTEDSLGL